MSIRNDIDKGFAFPNTMKVTKTLDDYIDNSITENLYGVTPQNTHQEWKQEMYKRFIDDSNGVCSGIYTNQSKNFGYRPPLENCAKTLKASAFDVGFVKGNMVRNFTVQEYWELQGFDIKDYIKAKSVVNKENKLKKQAGNSITVNVLAEIYKQLKKFYPNDFIDNIDIVTLFSGIGAFEKAFSKVD